MSSRTKRPSATSLPQSPRDEESTRIRRYLVTMGIRVACFVLLVAVQPYGWWTVLFGLGATFLPYFAVVLANVGQAAHDRRAENPELALPAALHAAADPRPVVRIAEADSPAELPAPDRSDSPA